MKRKPTLDELLATNPHLKLNEVLAALNQVRKTRSEMCSKKAGYRLANPFSSRRASVNSEGKDHRTIILANRSLT